MPSTAEFYNESDWQSSSGPIISRQFHLADLWPVGLGSEIGGGDKDILEGGLHPCVAIGPKAERARNMVGVVITYNAPAELVQVNVAPGFCFKAYVANVLTYAQGAAATFDQLFSPGEPVYVDDSDPLAAGVTLSRSPLNSADGANPIAGYLFYGQDEYADQKVGGPNHAARLPLVMQNSLSYALVTVILTGRVS